MSAAHGTFVVAQLLLPLSGQGRSSGESACHRSHLCLRSEV